MHISTSEKRIGPRITTLAGATNATFKSLATMTDKLEGDNSTIAQLAGDVGPPEPDEPHYRGGSLTGKGSFKIKEILRESAGAQSGDRKYASRPS